MNHDVVVKLAERALRMIEIHRFVKESDHSVYQIHVGISYAIMVSLRVVTTMDLLYLKKINTT